MERLPLPDSQTGHVVVSFICPHCHFRNTFLGYSGVFVYACGQCDENVDIRDANKGPVIV
jgi:uncharacterized protein (DUF983 family)